MILNIVFQVYKNDQVYSYDQVYKYDQDSENDQLYEEYTSPP